MKWIERTSAVILSPRDLEILSQCGVSAAELLRGSHGDKGLPPLWSALSFELLRNAHATVSGFWWQYRLTREMAADPEQHYSQMTIEKNGGGLRKLAVPSYSLAYRQQFIAQKILSRLPISPHAFAYRPGGRVQDCARPHERHAVLIHVDIRDFFSSIKREMVFQSLLRETGYTKSLVALLTNLCCYKGYLPQGACTSPALSNICFRPCDDALGLFAEDSGLTYTRYSDDLFFSGTVVDVPSVLKQIRGILSQHGFLMNEKKTRVLRAYHSQQVLGLVVNETTRVSRAYRRDLRQQIYYLKRFGADSFDATHAESYSQYLSQLLGRISYVLSIEPNNQEFQKARRTVISEMRGPNWEDADEDETLAEFLSKVAHQEIEFEQLAFDL